MNKEKLLSILQRGGINYNDYDIEGYGGAGAEIVYHLEKSGNHEYRVYITERNKIILIQMYPDEERACEGLLSLFIEDYPNLKEFV